MRWGSSECLSEGGIDRTAAEEDAVGIRVLRVWFPRVGEALVLDWCWFCARAESPLVFWGAGGQYGPALHRPLP